MAEVVVYSKQICPYCDRAKQLLSHKGVEYQEIRVDLEPERLQEMLEKSEGRRTVPQIIINGLAIGGFTDLWALEQNGQLDNLLNTTEEKSE